MDCEFVKSISGKELLARVSIVNFEGEIVLDTVVWPEEPIRDYITHITGLTSELLQDAPGYSIINQKVISIIRNATVVGHTL